MLKNRTVLILGAGASKAYGFPLGRELRDDVIRITSNHLYGPLFERCGATRRDVLSFATELSQSGFTSADAFLEKRPQWTAIGKAAMTFSLLATESGSKGKVFPPNQPNDHWYEMLWNIVKSPSLLDFKKQPLTIVTFNYDRSIEHYFAHVLANNYNISKDEAVSLLPIVHVHGSLGEYDANVYGEMVKEDKILECSNSIRIVHEAEIEHTEFVNVREEIREASFVLFLGFGYHDANMTKLGFPSVKKRGHLALGTHKGIKSQFWRDICVKYGLSASAQNTGAGSLSEFISEWLR